MPSPFLLCLVTYLIILPSRKVKSLPTITKEDITGMPIVGVVGKGRPYTNKNGKEVTPSEVKFVKVWSGGTKKEGNDAEIPF